MLVKIVSGGQTGVDQAALRAAAGAGLACGGWCPPGRLCETGVIPDAFALQETPTERSPDAPDIPRSLRSQWNVRDSDATLILRPVAAEAEPGSDWTASCTARYQRPLLICDPNDPAAAALIRQFLVNHAIRTLNIAGPSEGSVPGIGARTEHLLVAALGG